MERKFKLIVCLNKQNVIGRNGDLLYHIHNDMKNFKGLTLTNGVIMGRKTYDSLPNGKLPYRVNIIITRDEKFDSGDIVCSSIEDAIEVTKNMKCDLFVIGGASIYRQFLDKDLIDEAVVTLVDDNDKQEGDVILNNDFSNTDKWRIKFETPWMEENGLKFKYIIYKRKINKNY